jgi:hypothetical protein
MQILFPRRPDSDLPAIKAIKGNTVELAAVSVPIGLSYKDQLLNAIKKM